MTSSEISKHMTENDARLITERMRQLVSEVGELQHEIALNGGRPGEGKARPDAVYFIQQGESGPIKIGVASNPRARLHSLQTANPELLRLVGEMPGDFDAECALHARFAAARIHGEWFHATPELVQFIKEASA